MDAFEYVSGPAGSSCPPDDTTPRLPLGALLARFWRVSIQACPAVLSLIALCDRRKSLLCLCGEGRHPGVSGEGVADGGDDRLAVLACGVDVSADGVAVAGGGLGAEAAGGLLLGLRWPQVALGLVRGRRDPQVAQEPQDVVLAPLKAFQQHAAGF